ncbi:hypothetical protein DFR70_105283 [Nocardia tenerifensis]|uniref:Uncharacterized protein n=1 Tax=Nocardia tenerifensis TaxID=228006 RepID=A0A318KDQ2_9NOCA|nr:hypothetical protein DFR70_105283 [Nocardia tenerifensis]
MTLLPKGTTSAGHNHLLGYNRQQLHTPTASSALGAELVAAAAEVKLCYTAVHGAWLAWSPRSRDQGGRQ